ncbi:MAG: nucleoside phosphorylase [Saprospiraceae bacterium]|nr:nucleoside phosphorylase [Saprospiraceae bacterium]
MFQPLKESELILNSDGSVYHLNLLPQDIGSTIITVGDPERVSKVSKYFDSIDLKKGKREFHCHTGTYKGHRISVLSTGIGTDNIDIVFNELDALVNIDLTTRTEKVEKQSLKIIRIGTSGCFVPSIPVDGILLSNHGLGLEGLLNFYSYPKSEKQQNFLEALLEQTDLSAVGIEPYLFPASELLLNHFKDSSVYEGLTTTCAGFYAPQGRQLRLQPKMASILDTLQGVNIPNYNLTNFEMETAGIYGLAALLGHHALSVNVLIANRAKQTFSSDPAKAVDRAIQWVLDKLVTL